MAATNYAALVARIRADGNDTATSNAHFGETPVGLRNGTNTLFRLAYKNVVVGSLYMTYGAASIRVQTGFTVLDQPSSYLSVSPAPDAGTTQPFAFDYFAQWFPDADYQSFIDSATEEVGAAAGTDPGETYWPPLIKFALAHYWNRRASTFADSYAAKASTADADPSSPTKAFLALAKEARAAGNDLLKKAQKGFEQNLQPFSGTVTMGVDPITPRT